MVMSTVFILRAGAGWGTWKPPGGEDRLSQRRERGAWGRAERAGVQRAEKQPEPAPVDPVPRLLFFGRFFLWENRMVLKP